MLKILRLIGWLPALTVVEEKRQAWARYARVDAPAAERSDR